MAAWFTFHFVVSHDVRYRKGAVEFSLASHLPFRDRPVQQMMDTKAFRPEFKALCKHLSSSFIHPEWTTLVSPEQNIADVTIIISFNFSWGALEEASVRVTVDTASHYTRYFLRFLYCQLLCDIEHWVTKTLIIKSASDSRYWTTSEVI